MAQIHLLKKVFCIKNEAEMHFNAFNNTMKHGQSSQDGNWALQLPL